MYPRIGRICVNKVESIARILSTKTTNFQIVPHIITAWFWGAGWATTKV